MVQCPSCGGGFESVTMHWARSSTCYHPELPEPVREMVRGIYLHRGYTGLGTKGSAYPRFGVLHRNRDLLNRVRESLGLFARNLAVSEMETMSGVPATRHTLETVSHPGFAESSLRTDGYTATPLALTTAIMLGNRSEDEEHRYSRYELTAVEERVEWAATALEKYDPRVWSSGERDLLVLLDVEAVETDRLESLPDGWWAKKPYYSGATA